MVGGGTRCRINSFPLMYARTLRYEEGLMEGFGYVSFVSGNELMQRLV